MNNSPYYVILSIINKAKKFIPFQISLPAKFNQGQNLFHICSESKTFDIKPRLFIDIKRALQTKKTNM